MERAVKTFRSLAQVPFISSGKLYNIGTQDANKITVFSKWTQRCLERGKSVKFQQTHFVDLATEEVSNLISFDTSTEILSSLSSSEELRAVVREIPSSENASKKSQHLEIWRKSKLVAVRDLTTLDVHGDVYADGEFGCFEWSPCEKKLLYVAEKKVPKSEPFYKEKSQESVDKDSNAAGDSKVIKGDEYVYRQDWGEQLVGKHQPVFAVYDLQQDKIIVLEGIPDNVSPGQGIWAPDGGIVGIAWANGTSRLGLIYCTNRVGYVFHLTSDGQYRLLSSEGCAVTAPRFSPDGKSLIWLERSAEGPHHDAHRLVKYCWSSTKVDVVVDIVRNRFDGIDPKLFRGLFNSSLPRRCWLSDNIHIVVSTPGPSSVTSCIINTESKEITLIQQPSEESQSLAVLDVSKDVILCSRSNLRSPPALIIGHFSTTSYKDIKWIPVSEWSVFPGLENASCGVYNTSATTHVSGGLTDINALFITPIDDPSQKVPVIVSPHGGPHVNHIDAFSITTAFFTLLGYGVILVNYRGSSGFGQDYIRFLLGKIGDSDVKDTHQLAEELCNSKVANFDSNRKVLFGGSHGGFLVTHLSGQYPDSYKGVCALNPVSDVSSMIGVTDIPDWCAVVSGKAFPPDYNISKEDLNRMYDASPTRFASKVTAPTLLLLGKKDIRVPMSQGLLYHHILKAHNVSTRLLVYDDNHPLGQVPNELDFIINSLLWFNEHLKIGKE